MNAERSMAAAQRAARMMASAFPAMPAEVFGIQARLLHEGVRGAADALRVSLERGWLERDDAGPVPGEDGRWYSVTDAGRAAAEELFA